MSTEVNMDYRQGRPRLPALAVLAGGVGSRMGMPKSLLRMGGRPILRCLLEQMTWPGPTLLVTAPGFEHPPGSECFNEEVCDPVAGEGPLRGMLTALEHCQSDYLLVATVDMPRIRFIHLNWLMQQLVPRQNRWGVILCRDDRAFELEPFPCALRRSAKDLIREQLEAGRMAVRRLAEHEQFAVLPAPTHWHPEWWKNLNHPSDLDGTDIGP